ncbi:MAG TPA: hypothetical protein VMR86_18450 [Myxococcota bacterium]|nr:hypothetical protein [Myxococcota bacterium]
MASAAQVNPRTPVTVQGSTTPTLQQILDGLVVSGPAINANNSSGIQLWDNTSGPMTAQIVADFTGKSQAVKFGIYDADAPGAGVLLLNDNMKPSDIASVLFNDDASISVKGGKGGKKGKGFDGPFGFFAKVPTHSNTDLPFLFTEADLNGGQVFAKVFQGNGLTSLQFPGLAPGLFLTSQFLIAFETNNDGQFNDLIVSVSGLAVPEPALGLLLGLSLAALHARRARSA